jgi:hypothetical protein
MKPLARIRFRNSWVYSPAKSAVLAGVLTALTCGLTSLADGEYTEQSSGSTADPDPPSPLFTLLRPEETGIAFTNKVYEDDDNHPFGYTYFYNGGGVAIGDINNDGLPDLFFTGNMVPNKLYLNKGDFVFEDITDRAALGETGGWSNGVTMVDINLDGYLDIYVCRSYYLKTPTLRENLLFINNGDLTFREEAAAYRLNDPGFSVQAAFFDYDRDGDLDMYLGNHYNNIEGYDRKFLVQEEIPPDFVGDRLMRNNGDGTFDDVTMESGIENMGCALGVGIGDLNDDGWPDVYVANDFLVSDVLFLNNGDGTFTESIHATLKHSSFYGMGSALADFNNDGLLDIAVTDMLAADNYREKTMMSSMDVKGFRRLIQSGFHHQYMRNTLQLNNGNGTFSEIGYLAGIARTDWSYSVLLADFDNDGWKDMFVANGYRRDARDIDATNVWTGVLKKQGMKFRRGQLRELLELLPVNRLPNYLFKNNGDLTFSDRTAAFGLIEGSFSSGAAYGDLDNDGDLDLVVTNLMDPAFVYRNESESRKGGNYLRVLLKGPSMNPAGIGAKVMIAHNGGIQHQEFHVTRGFHSSVEYALHFGLGDTERIDSLRVIWPDGRTQEIGPERANQTIKLDYDEGREPDGGSGRSTVDTRMREVTDDVGVAFVHRENDYDDYIKEVLLPHKMSQFGPNIAVGDVNGDGRDDFYAGGAAQQTGVLYLRDGEGRFRLAGGGPWAADAGFEDVGALFFDADGDGVPDLYVVSGGNAFAPASHLYQDRLYINDGTGTFEKSADRLPVISASGSCVAAGDYDSDGDLDLFVGGRVLPGKYPFPAQSFVLNNDGGVFTDVTGKLAPDLREPGLVTSAVWSDYDGDGAVDLIVVGEWMPVSVFQNTSGQLIKRTGEYELENTTGWWNVIEAGDFDNDGDSDYVLGNLGLNYKYKATEVEPLHVYAYDFDENGSTDIVLGYYNDGVCYPVRGRECSSQQVPVIETRFPTYAAFGKATLTDVYGGALNEGFHLEAKMFASSTMENLGNGRFSIKPLPVEAQLSTVQSIVVQDFDGDRNLDLLISGNFYVSEVETGRADAGIGLLLTGDGHGKFNPVHVSASGFMADLDVRDLAIARSADGPSYILVGNNNDRMQVFRLKN